LAPKGDHNFSFTFLYCFPKGVVVPSGLPVFTC